MKHKVRVTVIDKKLYPGQQKEYCRNPESGMCNCYNVGGGFDFYRATDRIISGIAASTPRSAQTRIPAQWPAGRKCPIVQKPGMPSAAISAPDCRVVQS